MQVHTKTTLFSVISPAGHGQEWESVLLLQTQNEQQRKKKNGREGKKSCRLDTQNAKVCKRDCQCTFTSLQPSILKCVCVIDLILYVCLVRPLTIVCDTFKYWWSHILVSCCNIPDIFDSFLSFIAKWFLLIYETRAVNQWGVGWFNL